MGKFIDLMRRGTQENRRLDKALVRQIFTLPAMWLIFLLLAAVLGFGALVAAAENHKRWQHLSTPVSYARYANGQLERHQWYDDNDNLYVGGIIRTADGKQLNFDCRNLADVLCQYDEERWQQQERLPVQSVVQARWLGYRVITELNYTKGGIERSYRAAFSPQEEAEQWRRYARGWRRAALVVGAGWLWLSIAWYRRARRQRLRRQRQQQKAT